MTEVLILALLAAAGGLLFALAWWSSGRSRGVEHHSLADREHGEAEYKTMRHYRPNASNGPGPVI